MKFLIFSAFLLFCMEGLSHNIQTMANKGDYMTSQTQVNLYSGEITEYFVTTAYSERGILKGLVLETHCFKTNDKGKKGRKLIGVSHTQKSGGVHFATYKRYDHEGDIETVCKKTHRFYHKLYISNQGESETDTP